MVWEEAGIKLEGGISKSEALIQEAERMYKKGDYVKALKLSMECISNNSEIITNFNKKYL